MLKVICFVVFAVFSSVNLHAEISPENRYIYVMPLLSENSRDIFLAISSMRKADVNDPSILDIVAKQLLVHRDFENGSEMDVQALCGMVGILGESGLMRYQPLVVELSKTAHQKKFVSYVKEALESFKGESNDTFQAEQINVESIKNDLLAQKIASRTAINEPFDITFQEDTPIAMVYKRLGYPDAISIGFGQSLLVGMDFYYYDYGIIRLNHAMTSNKGWLVAWTWPERKHEPIDDSQPDAPLVHHLMTADSRQFLAVARFIERESISTPFVLDAIEERLKAGSTPVDSYEKKALNMLTKHLVKQQRKLETKTL